MFKSTIEQKWISFLFSTFFDQPSRKKKIIYSCIYLMKKGVLVYRQQNSSSRLAGINSVVHDHDLPHEASLSLTQWFPKLSSVLGVYFVLDDTNKLQYHKKNTIHEANLRNYLYNLLIIVISS